MNKFHSAMLVAGLVIGFSGSAMAQDAAAGEKVFIKCKACHQIGEGAKNGVGPLLNGIIGRKSGSPSRVGASRSTREPTLGT